MYSPSAFRSSDQNEAFELMDYFPFATVVCASTGGLEISHLPVTPKRYDSSIELIGHMARANTQWQCFKKSPVTVIFNGPHSYITPKWYRRNDVPTWNYMAVHARGTAEVIEDYSGLVGCLKDLTAHVERHWPSGWEFFMPEDLSNDRLVKSIVGFRIKVENIDFKKKLSQNRSHEDQDGVIKGLTQRGDDQSRMIRREMEKIRAK